MSELMWSNEPPVIVRGAYALAGAFRCLGYVVGGVGLVFATVMAVTSTDVGPEERVLILFVFGGVPVLAAMLLLFLGFLLALLAGIQNQLLPEPELERV